MINVHVKKYETSETVHQEVNADLINCRLLNKRLMKEIEREKEMRRKQNEEVKENIDPLEYQNVLYLSTLEHQHMNKEALWSKLYCIKKAMDAVEKENAESIERIVKEKEEKWLN